MKVRLLISFLWLAIVALQAQSTENLESVAADRPGMATGVGVLPFKTIQWEMGVQWDYTNR